MKKYVVALACAVAAAAPAAAAETVVFQSLSNLTGGTFAGSGNSYDSSFRIYDLFSLSSNATISTIDMLFFTSYGAKIPASGVLSIYAANGTSVGNLLFNESLSPSSTQAYTVSNYGMTLATFHPDNLSLNAGTYFLSIAGSNNTPYDVPTFSTSDPNDPAQAIDYTYQTNNAGYSTVISGTAAFDIKAGAAAAVPEPASWAMMVGGFGLLGAALRRRKTNVRFA